MFPPNHAAAQQARVCAACHSPNAPDAEVCRACSASIAGLPVHPIVDGRYQVLRELGRGGMGVVYRALDLGLRRDVALKVVSPDRAKPEETAKLQREAAAVARVRSDNVVQVYAFGPHGPSFFFAMEYVHGTSLAELVVEHATHRAMVPLSRAVSILRSVAAGLDAVHAAGVVHRDVKPANIAVEHRTGRAVLLDFGLAVERDERGGELAVGTPAYMAPEQIENDSHYGNVSPRTDVYALGCTAYEVLTGQVPFERSSVEGVFLAHLHDVPALASTHRPGLAPFDDVLARALRKHPDARYQTAGAFAAALSSALEVALEPESTDVGGPPSSGMDMGPDDGRPLEVLIVDDDPVFRRLAARCVQVAWYRHRIHVRSVDSGAAAVAAARDTMPALIILDYQMPGMSGVEALTRVRDLPGGTGARVIVASASVGSTERWRFGVLGVSDFIAKPIEMPGFVALLGELAVQAGWATSVSAVPPAP